MPGKTESYQLLPALTGPYDSELDNAEEDIYNIKEYLGVVNKTSANINNHLIPNKYSKGTVSIESIEKNNDQQ